MEREIRYCTTEDGVSIAYSVEGEGPALVVVPWFVGSSFLPHMYPETEGFFEVAAGGFTIIRYDMRGTGLSQREVADFSYEATVQDIHAVVKALRLTKLCLYGGNLGGPRAILYAAQYPRAVDKLILYATFARLRDVFSEQMLTGFAQLSRANWGLAARTFADVGVLRRQSEEAGMRVAQWYEASITGEDMARYIDENSSLDVTSALARVRCPTLIVHRTGDPIYPFEQAQRLAAAIPGARFVPLEGDVTWVDDPYLIHSFLSGTKPRVPDSRPDPQHSTLRTVLFTDVVGHTEMMQRLGDDKGREVLREHERITREVLAANGGTEIKTMGDGFMASFGSVTRAVECAIALQKAFAEREGEPLSVRVGLNAGEPIEEDGDLFGATVILASRIAAKAGGGEILVADTVRGLCSGKGFLFADCGEFVAKGIEEPVHVYEVSWRE